MRAWYAIADCKKPLALAEWGVLIDFALGRSVAEVKIYKGGAIHAERLRASGEIEVAYNIPHKRFSEARQYGVVESKAEAKHWAEQVLTTGGLK